MKNILIPFLLLVFMFSVVDEASAQRRGKKKRNKTEDTEDTRKRRSTDDDEAEFEGQSFMDNLNPEIKLGNLQFFGNIFQLSMKSNVGYKFGTTFSAGLGGKFDYFYRSVQGPNDEGFFSYGGFVYGRAKLGKQFYAQLEYNAFNTAFTLPRKTFYYPNAGIGYMYEGFNWSSGIELMVPLNDEVRDNFGILEYWITFSKNF